MAIKPEWITDLSFFGRLADEFEAEMNAAGDTVRAQSARSINQQLILGRQQLLAILKHLYGSFDALPKDQSQDAKERLILLVSFVQGTGHVEELIAEGQYIKACPALRQDYEFLTRLRELREGTARAGERLNVRNAPEGSQRFYGQLSGIVHPTRPALLLNFLQSWDQGDEEVVINHVPRFIAGLAAHLYLILVWLTFEFSREALVLYADLCGRDDALDRAAFELRRAIWTLQAAGLRFTGPEDAEGGAVH